MPYVSPKWWASKGWQCTWFAFGLHSPTVLPLSPAADACWCDRPECVRDVVGCCSLERAPAAVDAALQCIIQMAPAPALQVLSSCLSSFLSSCLSSCLASCLSSCYAADCCCLVSGTMHLVPLHLTMLQLCPSNMHSVFACVQDQQHVHHPEETMCSPLGASNSMCLLGYT